MGRERPTSQPREGLVADEQDAVDVLQRPCGGRSRIVNGATRSSSRTRSRATDVAECGVTATVRISANGTREKTWIESTAPSAAIEATGTRRRRSALRAKAMLETAETSSRPSRSAALSAVGTPSVNSSVGSSARSRPW